MGRILLLVSSELYFAVSGKARKAGLLSPTVFHPGQIISGFWGSKETFTRPFDSKAWKSHIITSTTHPFAQSKTEASAGSRGRERDSNSPWEKQEIIVTSFPPPLRAALLKLSY